MKKKGNGWPATLMQASLMSGNCLPRPSASTGTRGEREKERDNEKNKGDGRPHFGTRSKCGGEKEGRKEVRKAAKVIEVVMIEEGVGDGDGGGTNVENVSRSGGHGDLYVETEEGRKEGRKEERERKEG